MFWFQKARSNAGFFLFLSMLRSKNVFWMLAVLAFGYLGWQNPFVERGGNPRNQGT